MYKQVGREICRDSNLHPYRPMYVKSALYVFRSTAPRCHKSMYAVNYCISSIFLGHRLYLKWWSCSYYKFKDTLKKISYFKAIVGLNSLSGLTADTKLKPFFDPSVTSMKGLDCLQSTFFLKIRLVLDLIHRDLAALRRLRA